MNWEAVAAIGELAGAVGVIVSIAYLAVQVRDNTRSSRSATRQAISDSITTANLLLPQNPDFAKAFAAHVDHQPVERHQELQLTGFCYLYLRTWENVHYQYREGMLSDEEWESFRKNIKALLQIPVVQDFWSREHEVFVESFQREVRGLIEDIPDNPILTQSVLFTGGNE